MLSAAPGYCRVCDRGRARVRVNSQQLSRRRCCSSPSGRQYSMHERNTRTRDTAGCRHHCAPSTAAGQAAQALRGRSVGGHRRRHRLHPVGRLLFRRHDLRLSPSPVPPSRRDVQTRRPRRPGPVAVRRTGCPRPLSGRSVWTRPRCRSVRTWRPRRPDCGARRAGRSGAGHRRSDPGSATGTASVVPIRQPRGPGAPTGCRVVVV